METQTLYKNEILWAVNKPSHAHFNEILTQSDMEFWTPAHRLDFETSGVLLHCLKLHFDRVSQIFKDPSYGLQKYYIAGTTTLPQIPLPQLIRGLIASRYRRSKSVKFIFEASEVRGWHSKRPAHLTLDHSPRIAEIARDLGFDGQALEIRLITGARHQIRATLEALSAPIVGDPIYGPQPPTSDQVELHAHRLVLPANQPILQLESAVEIIAPKRMARPKT